MKPTPYFTFTSQGLTFTFVNNTQGTVDTYLWDFGFSNNGVPATSSAQTPGPITFPNSGNYNVSLTATNIDGSNTFTFVVPASDIPTIGLTISEMVIGEIGGISVNTNFYNSLVKKWQLWFQTSQNISDADVFDESKWPTLVNVLIAKLVVWDLISIAQKNLAISVSTSSSKTLFADYSITLDFTNPLFIKNIIIDAQSIAGPITQIASNQDLINWLNSLNMGTWVIDGASIKTIANTHTISALTYIISGDTQEHQVSFSQSNQTISTTNSNNYTTAALSTSKVLKRIETGPSNAEWFNPSEYWANLLKTNFLDNMKLEICELAGRVNVYLAMCPVIKRTKVFIVAKKYC